MEFFKQGVFSKQSKVHNVIPPIHMMQNFFSSFKLIHFHLETNSLNKFQIYHWTKLKSISLIAISVTPQFFNFKSPQLLKFYVFCIKNLHHVNIKVYYLKMNPYQPNPTYVIRYNTCNHTHCRKSTLVMPKLVHPTMPTPKKKD